MLPSANSSPAQLEAEGWEAWLTTLFPFAFDEEFSGDHRKFWDLYFSVLLRIRENIKYQLLGLPVPSDIEIRPSELVILYILGRGLGKSASVEPSAVMRGALLGGGYSLFISESDDQAQEHLGNTRILIDHPDSRLLEFYPDMAVTDEPLRGLPALDRRELFVTRCGWIARAKGLRAKMRGLRIGTRRPDDLNIDDFDDISDSVELSVNKLRIITSSILPVQAKQFTTIKFTQNLISEQSVMNQVHLGRSDALAERTTIGPTKMFTQFDYETYTDPEDGRLKHRILPTSIPSWKGVDIAKAQKFLNDSGLVTFMAEYQNEFELQREGRVLRNYNDGLMVITKSDFERVLGTREVPDSFNKYVGHDWARTKSAYHANVAGKLAVSNQNTKLPGKLFLFDLMSFEAGTQADDVGRTILESISTLVPGSKNTWKELIEKSLSRAGLEEFIADSTRLLEARRDVLARIISPIVTSMLAAKRYLRFLGSHDQNNDALQLYRRVYGLPFEPCNPGETGGLEWADHYMTVDKKTPHPFFEDEQMEDGTWKLGCPGMFLVVEDSKYPYPQSVTPDALHGSDLCRYQFSNWRMRPAKITEAGFIEHGPMKMNDDFGQMLQMLLVNNLIHAIPLSRHEKVVEHMPVHTRLETLQKESPYPKGLTPAQELTYLVALKKAQAQVRPDRKRFDEWGKPLD